MKTKAAEKYRCRMLCLLDGQETKYSNNKAKKVNYNLAVLKRIGYVCVYMEGNQEGILQSVTVTVKTRSQKLENDISKKIVCAYQGGYFCKPHQNRL